MQGILKNLDTLKAIGLVAFWELAKTKTQESMANVTP